MTITTNDDRDEYTATASQTVFNYTFKIFASTDLNVYQTPAGQTANDSTDLITAYTVSGVGSSSGGTITLTTPASAGDLITIVSDIPSSRTTDYQVSGDFVPATVNNDFDRMVSLAKQAEGLARRSLLFEESQQGVQAKALPKPDPGKVFSWDESGNVVYRSITDLATTIDINSTVDVYPHMADFITRTPTKDLIYIESYPVWSPGVTTPKGDHYRYRTGGTNTSPTVGSPVAVSTIGTGTQAGYAWTADGVEWYIKPDQRITPMMFGATADGSNDYTPVNDALIYCQANSVNLYGDRSNTHTINSTINITVANTEIYGLRLVASATMEALLKITSGINGVKIAYCNLDCNCSTPDNQDITADGAERGIYGVNCSSSQIYKNTIYDYRTAGVHLHLTSAGMQMVNNQAFNNTISGIESLVITSVRATAGVRIQNEYNASASAETDILLLDDTNVYRARNNRVFNNTIRKSRYCVDVTYAESTSVYENDLQYCTRGISSQHLCKNTNIYSNRVKFYESVGIHGAYGGEGLNIFKNSVTGTGHLDSSGIQVYYGVQKFSIEGNSIDSEFDLYDGSHLNNDVTNPDSGIRIGQYVLDGKITNNTIKGFQKNIFIKSTVYESTITSADANYYNTGFRNIKISGNTLTTAYTLATTTGVREAMPQSTTYGIYIYKSGTWEDTAQGSLNLYDVRVSGNTSKDAAYNFVIQDGGVSGSNRPTWTEVMVSENTSENASVANYTATGLIDAAGSIRATNNTWQDKQTYAASNVVSDRTYDADATTLAELSDVVGTLISDLRLNGIVN